MQERPVLVAPDSFKGTFRAAQVAGAIGRGLERAGLMPPDLLPLADGGDGPLDALLVNLGGETLSARVQDPLGRKIEAGYGLIEDGGTALIEMAAASGLSLVAVSWPQNAANSSVGPPPWPWMPAWRSQTSVSGIAPSDHRQRAMPASDRNLAEIAMHIHPDASHPHLLDQLTSRGGGRHATTTDPCSQHTRTLAGAANYKLRALSP
jgi:hypothetical protein